MTRHARNILMPFELGVQPSNEDCVFRVEQLYMSHLDKVLLHSRGNERLRVA
jgi:hypothetical protein